MQIEKTPNHRRKILATNDEWEVFCKILDYCKTYFDELELDSLFWSLNLAPDDPDDEQSWFEPIDKLILRIKKAGAEQQYLFDDIEYAILFSAITNVYQHILDRPDTDQMSELSFKEKACLSRMYMTYNQFLDSLSHDTVAKHDEK